jgi:hypothetical protein
MGFFDGVLDCNKRNGGAHPWSPPYRRGADYRVDCEDDCRVSCWGKTPDEAMANAQDFDRANRRGRL